MVFIKQFESPDIKDVSTMEIRASFMEDSKINSIVVNKASGRSYYVIMELDTPMITPNSKCRVKCSCQDFTFRWAAVLHKYDASLESKQMGVYADMMPDQTNPDYKIDCCKHIKYTIREALKGNIKPLSSRPGHI